MRVILFLSCIVLSLVSCGEESVAIPKPRIYPRVIYPEKTFVKFDEEFCKFTFQRPGYTKVVQDTLYFDEEPKDPCWFNLVYPDFDASIYFSYAPITNANNFEKRRNDAFVFAQKHNVKANYIDEFPINKSPSVQGFLFNMEGAVASPFQFYLSDQKDNFLRGSLYFNTKARPDSLAPMVDFIREDALKLIESFEWK